MMEEQRKTSKVRDGKSMHRVRISRPSRLPKKSWIEEAHEVRKSILEARGGVPVPSTAEVISEMREEDER